MINTDPQSISIDGQSSTCWCRCTSGAGVAFSTTQAWCRRFVGIFKKCSQMLKSNRSFECICEHGETSRQLHLAWAQMKSHLWWDDLTLSAFILSLPPCAVYFTCWNQLTCSVLNVSCKSALYARGITSYRTALPSGWTYPAWHNPVPPIVVLLWLLQAPVQRESRQLRRSTQPGDLVDFKTFIETFQALSLDQSRLMLTYSMREPN